MTDFRHSVLLMDDEVATADIVRYAIDALQRAGFDVHTTDRMSEAMDAFYQRYYHVFILDIDMGSLVDLEEGDGGDVARFLRTLDSDTHVIFFSARGHVHHWFAAANYHVYGYVHKNDDDAISELVTMVQQAADTPEKLRGLPLPIKPPKQALFVRLEPCQRVSQEQLETLAQQTLPDWQVEYMSDLQEALAARLQRPQSWGLIVVLCERFSARPSTRDRLSQLCTTDALPHVVIGCCGEVGLMPSILHMVNTHPFRLLDLLSPTILSEFAQAIQEAVHHYGRKELLGADSDALRRLRLAFSAETYERMLGSPELDETFWPDEAQEEFNP